MTFDLRPTPQAPDDDPYLWLEEVEGARALAWIETQNARTQARFGGPNRDAGAKSLAAIYDRPDNIPHVTRRGPHLYNYWKDANNPRGLWRRTTMNSFRTDKPDWEIVLDLDALAGTENEDWIWHGASTLSGSHDRAIMRLSRGGGDAVVLREFDIPTKSFVANGFNLPEAKGSVAWIDQDTLLVSSALGQDMATTSGYARTIRLWTRGQPITDSKVLFETDRTNMIAWGAYDPTYKDGTIWYLERTGFFDGSYAIGDRTGPKHTLDLPSGISLQTHRGWLALSPREDWTTGNQTHPADTLLGISLDAFLAGERNFSVLYEPQSRRALRGFFWNNGKLIVSILDELQPVFEIHTPAESGWTRGQLPDLPAIGMVHLNTVDSAEEETNGDLFVNAQDPLNPATLSIIEAGKPPAVLKRAPRTFDADNMVTTQHEAVSIDGERIPYFQTGPAKTDGKAPVHLSGYGGFGASSIPYYNSAIGKLWLECGGTHVTANIRGGGEFGVRWHEAGRREKKPLSHDDFAAVAADLVKRGITIPSRIAAEGGSNGGILITNMLTRYPDRFGALFCTIPLIDMRRYSKLLAGASWIAEYGDPDKPEDWAFLQDYSAYHQAKPEQDYPPILIATTRRDDRVHPGHARKMTAKLQAMGHDNAWFYEPAAGGHGYGKDNSERAAFTALGYAFLKDNIGWT